jgi:hypothetical protein
MDRPHSAAFFCGPLFTASRQIGPRLRQGHGYGRTDAIAPILLTKARPVTLCLSAARVWETSQVLRPDGGMMNQLHTEREQRFINMAAELADDFAKRAAQHDQDESFPFENYEQMRECGYTNLTIPEQFGGLGASLLERI